jgi:2-oxoisovalerate dehydrogenase E1 component
LVLTSREIDRVEEVELAPRRLVSYQFSARGHELAQALLATALDHPHDAAGAYYRSRPFVLGCGLTAEEAFAATMGRQGGPTAGRDIGVVHSLVPRGRATVLPVSGDVGAQYSPAAGWAHAVRYRSEVMGDEGWRGAMAVALGGDGSTATPGFWSALTLATTAQLPLLLFVEDNGYAISVPAALQCPGANIAANLASFGGLRVLDGDGTDPSEAAHLIHQAVGHVRSGRGPALLRLAVPRICGHSFADNQAYKTPAERDAELAADPLPRLRDHLLGGIVTAEEWAALEAEVVAEVAAARDRALAQPEGPPETARQHVFFEAARPQEVGGTRPEGAGLAAAPALASPAEPTRLNMIDAIRRTLIGEMELSPRVLVFGEDVGLKGGVHGATRDLQHQFGDRRVFDTPLCEEGIIGRAVGLAYAGLIPVPEIQFRKYADPATEQLNDCGTIRWRTAGRFAAPMVVRIPVGVSRATGDPWHSVTGEAIFAHTVGWRIAFPSNAEDAVGLLRTALRGDDPTYFLEHRTLYDGAAARRPYPGDDFQLPFGRAARVRAGSELTVVTWGDMVHHCLEAAADLGEAVEILDLRTIVPWDRAAVLESVRRTGRCLVVHEDTLTAGFGAEIAATVAAEAFPWLDAPVERLASADCPVPYSPQLLTGVVPGVAAIRAKMAAVLAF